jgi:hypothetical protein
MDAPTSEETPDKAAQYIASIAQDWLAAIGSRR